MSENKMNIYQRIQAVMQDIQYLAKDDQVAFGTTKYKAISEEKVTTSVRSSMIKNGLVMYPETQEISMQEISKEKQITTVNVTYRMVNVDNPNEQIMIASSGQGSDTQDKGSGKAMTYAFKYALLRTFMIPTGEDPDKISSAELDARQQETSDDMLMDQILALAKGDLTRVNTFIAKFLGEDKNLSNLEHDEYVKVKVAIARQVQQA